MDSRYPVVLSSWAVHRSLGVRYPDSPDGDPVGQEQIGPETMDLRFLPAAAKARGFGRLELVHFHFDRRDPALVNDFRGELDGSGVTLQTLLIDEGDLAHPDPEVADRHEAWIASWIEIGVRLGAERARIVGGKTRREGDVEAVAPRLLRLAGNTPLRLVTENWLATLCDPDQTLRLLDRCGDSIGLNVDLGNWTCAENHAWIERIAGRAEVCHAKCEVTNGENDLEGFGAAVDAAIRGGYVGPLTLVNGAGGDREWSLVGEQREFLQARPHPAS